MLSSRRVSHLSHLCLEYSNFSSIGGQTNLRIPQGTVGQVMLDDRAYLVRWEYSYSSWTLFTCEIEMLLHVVSTAGKFSFFERVMGTVCLLAIFED